MTDKRSWDVIIAGGGIAGAALAGVLARADLGVLLIERESRFRDRIRGEFTWPWGVAEARQLGLEEVLHRAGRVELEAVTIFENQQLVTADRFEGTPMFGFPHPRVQEELFTWAAAGGAKTLRPAKVTSFARNGAPTLTVAAGGREETYTARLVVGADGKQSAARQWAGGETAADPVHHRFGGVLVSGVPPETFVLSIASTPQGGLFWFPQSAAATRLYLRLTAPRLRESHADRSFAAFASYAAERMPPGVLDRAEQTGPLGFFPNNAVWATRIAGDKLVLIGDAAGAPDPSWGQGTSLVFRDVRELRDLLLSERDWNAAVAEFARRRRNYYEVVRAYERWMNQIAVAEGPEADRRRERYARAKEQDPTLGGFALIEVQGPDGLVPDEADRRQFFGEDLD